MLLLLLQDVGGGGQWSGSRAFAPLEAELLEQQHNNLFDACFELCAHDTHGALVEMSGPLWSACAARLRDARGSMPPRVRMTVSSATEVRIPFTSGSASSP